MVLLFEIILAMLVVRIVYGAYRDYCGKHQISTVELLVTVVKWGYTAFALLIGYIAFTTQQNSTAHNIAIFLLLVAILINSRGILRLAGLRQ